MSKQAVVVRSGEGEKLAVTGGEVRLLCEADKTDRKWSVLECVLPEKSGPPPHEHPWDEAYYIVDGEVRFTLGDKDLHVKAGDFLYAPSGTLHGFQTTSERPARMLVFDAPAAAGDFFRDVDREVKEFPRDAGKLPEIGVRHGIRFA